MKFLRAIPGKGWLILFKSVRKKRSYTHNLNYFLTELVLSVAEMPFCNLCSKNEKHWTLEP